MALHLVAVVIWIGGVGFVTTVLIPSVKREHRPEQRLAAFLKVEDRFVWQARGAVLLAGLSGLWMLDRMQLWSAFAAPGFWWLHAMVGLWTVFAAMLFVIEPLFLHRRLAMTATPERAFRNMEWLHRILFVLSLVTVFGAAAGSHGL
jgi:uncharacterized membrane protein